MVVRVLVRVLFAVAMPLFAAAVLLVIVAIADGTFGMPGSTTGLASTLSIASAYFSITATVLKRRSARARSDDDDTDKLSSSPPR